MNLERALSVYDMGDHWLVEHSDEGMVPVSKAGADEHTKAALTKLAAGVVGYAVGGDVEGEADPDDDSVPRYPEKSRGPQVVQQGTPAELYLKNHSAELTPDERRAIIEGNGETPTDADAPNVPTAVALNDASMADVDTSQPVAGEATARKDAARLATPAPIVATTTVQPNGAVTVQHYAPRAGSVIPGDWRAGLTPAAAPEGLPFDTSPQGLTALGQGQAEADAAAKAAQDRQLSEQHQREAMGLPPVIENASPQQLADFNRQLTAMGAAPAATTQPLVAAPPAPAAVAPAAPAGLSEPAPQPAATAPGAAPTAVTDYAPELNEIAGRERSAVESQAAAKADLDAQLADLQDTKAAIIEKGQRDFQAALQKNLQRRQAIYDAVNKDIDPSRVLKDAGPFNSTLALIGLGIGGFASSWGHTPNYAYEIYKNAVENDMRSQESNQRRNLDLLRMSDAERQQIIDEHNLRKVDALDTVAAIVTAKGNRANSLVEKANGLKQAAEIDRNNLSARLAAATNAWHLAYDPVIAKYNAKSAELGFRQTVLQHNLMADALGLDHWDDEGRPVAAVKRPQPMGGTTGADPQVVAGAVQRAMDPGKYGVHTREPKIDESGIPLTDARGDVLYQPVRARTVTNPEERKPYEDKRAYIEQLEGPFSKLAALVRAHPEGAPLDPTSNTLAEEYRNQVAQLLNEAASGSTRNNETDVGLAKAMSANLGTWDSILGRNAARIKAMGQYLRSLRSANDIHLDPDIFHTGGR